MMGTKDLSERPRCIGNERARKHLLFYSILFYSARSSKVEYIINVIMSSCSIVKQPDAG